MTTTNRPDALDVLTQAADLAQEAVELLQGSPDPGYRLVRLSVQETAAQFIADGYPPEDARVLAASNPDHWRTIAATLRTTVEWNGLVAAVELRTPEDYATSSTTIAALLPLAEQVLRDLATATGGAA